MRNGAEFTIKVVNNGIIVTWICHGLDPLKEPYSEYQGVYVFRDWKEVSEHVLETHESGEKP